MPVLAWLGAWLASATAKMLIDKIVMFLAIKAVLVTLFIVVVPIMLNNLLVKLMSSMLNFATAATAGGGSFGGVVAFAGVGAWLIDCWQLNGCLSIMTAALQLRLLLSMIPFIGFKS
jgi:hypothetical protein